MSDYKGFLNPELKTQPTRIFTREEIKMMNPDEYTQNEKAIFYQMNTIGIPTKTEIENSSGVVHVRAYTKSDGTHVREHYRSYPDGYSHFSLQSFHETNPDNVITEIPDQKPANKTTTIDQINMAEGGAVSGPLIGGIAIDTVSSSIAAGSIVGAVAGVLGIVGGIALLTFGIIYASKHPDKVKKAGKEIYETLAETSRELSDQIAKNLPAIEKQLSSTPAGKRTVKILKDLNNFNNNNSNNPQIFYDDNSREKYKSISRDLLNESKNLLKEQEINQKALLEEIAKTSDQRTYEYLMDKYSTNKSLINNQSSQINKMEHYVDNDQLEEVVKESENNVLKGTDSIQKADNIPNNHQQVLQGSIYKDVFNMGSDYKIPYQGNFEQILQNSKGTYPYYEINNINADNFRRSILNSITDLVNYFYSNNLQISAELMHHAIQGLSDILYTPDCKILVSPETMLLEILSDDNLVDFIRYNNYENLPGIEYNSNSQIAQQISTSPELQQFITKNYLKLVNDGIKISSITFNSKPDLRLSIHKAWILNSSIKNGTFYATVYDKYDFEWLTSEFSASVLANDTAYILQEFKQISNYYIIIDIKVPIINTMSNKR